MPFKWPIFPEGKLFPAQSPARGAAGQPLARESASVPPKSIAVCAHTEPVSVPGLNDLLQSWKVFTRHWTLSRVKETLLQARRRVEGATQMCALLWASLLWQGVPVSSPRESRATEPGLSQLGKPGLQRSRAAQPASWAWYYRSGSAVLLQKGHCYRLWHNELVVLAIVSGPRFNFGIDEIMKGPFP